MSFTFVDELSAFLTNLYGELTNAENQTTGSEAWSLVCSIVVCSIVRWMFDDIAVHRLASVDFNNGVKQQVATENLWARYRPSASWPSIPHTSPTSPFGRTNHQLPLVPSSSAVLGVQRAPGGR